MSAKERNIGDRPRSSDSIMPELEEFHQHEPTVGPSHSCRNEESLESSRNYFFSSYSTSMTSSGLPAPPFALDDAECPASPVGGAAFEVEAYRCSAIA